MKRVHQINYGASAGSSSASQFDTDGRTGLWHSTDLQLTIEMIMLVMESPRDDKISRLAYRDSFLTGVL